VLGLRLELERPNPSLKPSHADSLTLRSVARVVLGRSVNGELTENDSCARIGDGYAVNRTAWSGQQWLDASPRLATNVRKHDYR